jgi:hypothetical protein
MIGLTHYKIPIPPWLQGRNLTLTYEPSKTTHNTNRRCIMAEEKTQDYFDENNTEGHVDTRGKNFECEDKDEHLGCDMGIDVQG